MPFDYFASALTKMQWVSRRRAGHVLPQARDAMPFNLLHAHVSALAPRLEVAGAAQANLVALA